MKRTMVLLLVMVFSVVLAACGAETAVSELQILQEADDQMKNIYSLLAVNPEAPFVDTDGNAVSNVTVNTVGADALIGWMLSQEAKDLCGS